MEIVRHIGPRLHRFLFSFFRRTDHAEAVHLHQRVRDLMERHDVLSGHDLKRRISGIAAEVADGLRLDRARLQELTTFLERMVIYEGWFQLPDINFADPRTTSQYWALKDELLQQKQFLERFDEITDAIRQFATDVFGVLNHGLADSTNQPAGPDDITVQTRRIDRIADLSTVVESMAVAPYSEAADHLGLFKRLRKRLDANLVAASGGNPRDPESFSRQLKWPTKSGLKESADIVGTYLSGTPLLELFEGEEPFTIPQEARLEHHHIIAGSGHGKTQTLQYLIGKDIGAVARGERSIVVIDSQGDLIRNIAGLKFFAYGEPLYERIVHIDPTDIEYPVSLNLFDIGQERLTGYAPLERERLTNSIIELYDFVLGTLLSAEMTQKQSVIFRYVTRLMLHIPDATIDTLRQLLEKGSEIRFAEHIAKLKGTARHFFENEFWSKEFAQTRSQVLRRLYGILENQTFANLFAHPRSKLDLYSEMNTGKVILINTAKDLLKNEGSEIFGRFFIALIAQAAQERAVLPESRRLPTIVYIDEASEYFDRNIGLILSQARKYKIGMVLAHQYLGQLDGKLQEAVSANTAIKFAGGFTGREARAAATMIGCEPELIESQPKGGFAAFVRGVTKAPIPLRFPLGKLEELPKMNSRERADLRDKMRQKYATQRTDLGGEAKADRNNHDAGPEPNSDTHAKPHRTKHHRKSQQPDEPDDLPDTDVSPNW